MLLHRVLTAVVALPLLIWTLTQSPAVYVCLLFLLCVALSVHEMSRMIYPAFVKKFFREDTDLHTKKSKIWTLFSVSSGILMYSVSTMLDLSGTERGGIIAVFNIVMLVSILSSENAKFAILHITCILLSLCYGCLPWLTVWDLYLMGPHARYLLLVLTIVMVGDTGAYFAGKHYGKRKLAPHFSPNKTWEGFFGGLLASILAAQIFNFIFHFQMGPWWLMLLLASIGGCAGAMGDLVESSFKRFSKVKDSGSIFPGHGGFLDRVDSLLFAAPICWLILHAYKNLRL